MNNLDVVVAGGGPCGSFAAFNLAKRGIDVTVFEEHSEIGVPSHCPGHLSIKGLKNLGLYPLPSGIIENVFCGANFHSPNGTCFSVRFAQPVTCAVNRVVFDKYISALAEKAGAVYQLDSNVDSLIIEDGFVKGVNVNQHGRTVKFFSKIVIDAEGISSRILKQTGLASLDRRMVVNGVHVELENVRDMDPSIVEVFLGNGYASGFYAWLIPKKDGKAKLGLAAKTGNPKKLLQKLMREHPAASEKLRASKILQTAFHPVTLGGPIPKTCSNGFLVVGDAASQVKPTTGGGVIFGMNSARIASEVVYEALGNDDVSSAFLSECGRRCREVSGFDMNVMLQIRKMLDAMSDKNIDDAISFCKKLRLDEILQNFEDIDFQGQSILRLLRSPRMLVTLFYFFLLYLSANP